MAYRFYFQVLRSIALAAVVSAVTVLALAQGGAYPNKPITLTHGYGGGGSSDLGCRLLAEALSRVIGQPVIVEPRPGAGGQIAWSKFKHSAKPDGYELIYINIPQIQSIIFDPARKADFALSDFKMIANHVQDPNILIVPRSSPYKTLEEFVAAAKANPGKLSITTSGLGSDDHLAVLDLQLKTGISLNIIHFKGDADALNSIMGGHVDSMMANVGGMVQTVESGQTRVLGVMARTRASDLPDVPTFEEKGYPLFASSTRGIAVPANTPPAIVSYLEQALKKAIESPAHEQAMKKAGFSIKYMGAAEYSAFLDTQNTWIKDMMKQYAK